jgi:hypothetical protein
MRVIPTSSVNLIETLCAGENDFLLRPLLQLLPKHDFANIKLRFHAVIAYHYLLYYIHFEINGVSCNVIGSQECDFSTNRTAIRAEIALL